MNDETPQLADCGTLERRKSAGSPHCELARLSERQIVSSGLCVTGTVGLLPSLQCLILASSRANAFWNHRRAEAKIPEKGRDCSTATDRRWYLRFPRSQRVKERETLENVETRLVTGTGFLRHALQYG